MGFTVETVSISGAPTITFRVDGDVCRAELAGAKLYAEMRGDGGIDLRLTDATGFVLADLVVNPRPERDATENITDIGSALLWSHWRFTQAPMSGDAKKHTAPALTPDDTTEPKGGVVSERYSVVDLRAHLVECFESDCCMVGNTTQREIVQSIDDALAERDALRSELEAARAEIQRLSFYESTSAADAIRMLSESRAELARVRPVYEAAKDVLSERRAKIMHARETTAMCRLQRTVDAAVSSEAAGKEEP